VLYMAYYPAHLRYVESGVEESELQPLLLTKTRVMSREWALSIVMASVRTFSFFPVNKLFVKIPIF
jgi:hypothetical protein